MKGKLSASSIEEFISNTEQLISFFSNTLLMNGKMLCRRMIHRLISNPAINELTENLDESEKERKARCILAAYQVWACGAYCNRQRTLTRSDLGHFLRAILDHAHRALGKQEFSLFFETVRFYEKDKLRQGANVIKLVLETYDIVSYRHYIDDRVALTNTMLPLAEFFTGCVIVLIEKHFRPEMLHESAQDFYQYLSRIEKIFEIEKSKLIDIVGIPAQY